MVRVYPERRKFTIGKLPEEQRLTCSGSWGQIYQSLQSFKFAFLPHGSKNHCKDCYVRPMPSDHGAGRNAANA